MAEEPGFPPFDCFVGILSRNLSNSCSEYDLGIKVRAWSVLGERNQLRRRLDDVRRQENQEFLLGVAGDFPLEQIAEKAECRPRMGILVLGGRLVALHQAADDDGLPAGRDGHGVGGNRVNDRGVDPLRDRNREGRVNGRVCGAMIICTKPSLVM